MRWIPARRCALGLLGLLGLVLAGCAPPPVDSGGYRIVFQDHFNGTALNPIWATAPFGNSLPATVDDGLLTITSTAANGHRWGYLASTGPRQDGEPSYPFAHAWQEGYFEARIRFTDSPWSWPAFWLFSLAKTEAWPDEDCRRLIAEWDVMENGVENADGTRPASSWYFSALHRNTSDGTDDGYCGTPDEYLGTSRDFTGTDLSDWHVWSGLWTAGELCTYLDGVEIQCMAPYDSTPQPLHLTLTMQYLAQCDGCPPRPAELEMQVDWVRVWQPR
jgi:beta-glucanase (GH16 family)